METLWNRNRKKRKKKIKEKKEINDRLLKDKTIRDIGTLFEKQEEKDYYKPKRARNFWNNNYIEYKCNGDKKRNLLLDE